MSGADEAAGPCVVLAEWQDVDFGGHGGLDGQLVLAKDPSSRSSMSSLRWPRPDRYWLMLGWRTPLMFPVGRSDLVI